MIVINDKNKRSFVSIKKKNRKKMILFGESSIKVKRVNLSIDPLTY